MIDVREEDLIDLREACREPVFFNRRTNKPGNLATIYRHITRGARAVNGERIRLETIRTPRGLLTSREAIQRFVENLTDPEADRVVETSLARKRRVDEACTELTAAGFKV